MTHLTPLWLSFLNGLEQPCDLLMIIRYTGWWLSPTPLKNDGLRQLG